MLLCPDTKNFSYSTSGFVLCNYFPSDLPTSQHAPQDVAKITSAAFTSFEFGEAKKI